MCILSKESAEKISADKTRKNPHRQQVLWMWFLWQNFYSQWLNERAYKERLERDLMSVIFVEYDLYYLHPSFLLLYNHISHMRDERWTLRCSNTMHILILLWLGKDGLTRVCAQFSFFCLPPNPMSQTADLTDAKFVAKLLQPMIKWLSIENFTLEWNLMSVIFAKEDLNFWHPNVKKLYVFEDVVFE